MDIGTIRGMPYKLELIDCKTNSVLYAFDGSYNNISINWSPNSRYISISYGNEYYYYEDVFDVKNLKFVSVYNIAEIENIIKEKFNQNYKSWYPSYFSFMEWVDDNKIKIHFFISSSSSIASQYEGWYIYDLVQDKIIEEDIQKR